MFRAAVTAADNTDFAVRHVGAIAPGSDPSSDTLLELGGHLSTGAIVPAPGGGNNFDYIAADGGVGANGTLLNPTLASFGFSVPDNTNFLHLTVHMDDQNAEFAFDNFLITGDAIPEPSTGLLALTGMFFLVAHRRRS